jgi:hypothetical protein
VEQNIRIPVDLTKAQYLVTANSGPKIADRRTGEQKIDRLSKLPMWTTELTQIGGSGARVIQVTTVGQSAPSVAVGQTVIPEGLEAMPWQSGTGAEARFGIAYRADELRVAVAA